MGAGVCFKGIMLEFSLPLVEIHLLPLGTTTLEADGGAIG